LLLLGGIFDYDVKLERLQELSLELEAPDIWSNIEKATQINQEKASIESSINSINTANEKLEYLHELISIIDTDDDPDLKDELYIELDKLDILVKNLEFLRMFNGKMDNSNAFLEIQSGSGGTEAQDWAEMLLRMYLRWGDSHKFKTEILEVSAGDVAGIKGATVKFTGDYAFGWLRTETGVHRLVRKSPFDSGSRRHTSFASVFVSPEVDEKIDIDINPADLKIDTYRASGAGGQHVNRTDSAVRITHIPTNTVVQCQSDRSQHKNKAQAMNQLRSKLYELELNKQNEDKQKLEDSKLEITWGSQIRSYVLDSSRIKDLRTGVETGNTAAVLDGGIDLFIKECLKQGV
tara:strand:+ start:8803 stop:9849 length:1047 start_codon:yes stop_codon:yes gene_type:complete